MADEFLPEGSEACLSQFFSAEVQRTLSSQVVNEARRAGLNLAGTVAAGFSPNAFTFPDPSAPHAGIVQSDAAWGRGAKLRVHFLPGGSLRTRERVETFAKLWSEVADVEFQFGVPKAQSDIRIAFNLPGFYSRLGMEARLFPQETMSLGFQGNEPEAEFRRLILHEFGHALGFHHEHRHPDAGIEWDDAGALAYYRPRLPPTLSNADILSQLHAIPPNSFRYKFFQFDPASIMMYFIPPEAVKPGRYIPDRFGRNNTQLSESDQVVVSTVYGPPPNGPVKGKKLTVGGAPFADRIDSDGEVDNYFFQANAMADYIITVTGDALVHVDLSDAEGKPPFSSDRGADTTSPVEGVTMKRFLPEGRWNISLTGSRFATGFASGTYTIRVIKAN
jgi:hypothetical protein